MSVHLAFICRYMNLFQLFSSKDKVFHVLFEQVGQNVLSISQLFQKFSLSTASEERKNFFKEMKQIERANDELTLKISIELGRNFITPFDREDIHSLAAALDEVVNLIYASAKRISFYEIEFGEKAIIESIAPIMSSTKAVNEGILALRMITDTERMNTCLKTIKRAEKEADDIFDNSIQDLFKNTDDIKELIKKREIYKFLESITDQCKAVSTVLGTISIKYA